MLWIWIYSLLFKIFSRLNKNRSNQSGSEEDDDDSGGVGVGDGDPPDRDTLRGGPISSVTPEWSQAAGLHVEAERRAEH